MTTTEDEATASLQTLNRLDRLERRVLWQNIRLTLVVIGSLLAGWAFNNYLDGREVRSTAVNKRFHDNACAFLVYVAPIGPAKDLLAQMRKEYPDCPAYHGVQSPQEPSATPTPSPSSSKPVTSSSVAHSPGPTYSRSSHQGSSSPRQTKSPIRTHSPGPPDSTQPGPSPTESGLVTLLCVELRMLGLDNSTFC